VIWPMLMHQTPEKEAARTTIVSIASNALLATIKGITGILGHSHALVADAIESLADIFSSILVLVGIKYAERPADANHPYGHGRAEALITFVVVGFLITSALFIGYTAIQNIRTPHLMPEPYTLIVLACIIVWKEISYRWVLKKGKEIGSSSLEADAWHHRSDAITSIAAFAGISLALLLGEGYESADDWAALLAAGFILYNSYLIFRPALGEIMDEHVHEELERNIRKISLTVSGIRNTEKCFIRKAGMKYHVDLHASVDAHITVKEGHDLAHKLKDTLRLQLPQLGNVLIHIEPFPHKN